MVMQRLDRWYHTQLWPEDMPSKSLVVICGQDKLLPVPEILTHLKHSPHPVKVIVDPSLGHGGMFFNSAYKKRTMTALKNFFRVEAEGEPSTEGLSLSGALRDRQEE